MRLVLILMLIFAPKGLVGARQPSAGSAPAKPRAEG